MSTGILPDGNARPQTFEIFMPSGFRGGIRRVSLPGVWAGKALMCRRAAFPDFEKSGALSAPGVYMLYGSDDQDDPFIYIGQSDSLTKRLRWHFQSTERFPWTDLICFLAGDGTLHMAHVKYLESRLVHLAKAAKRCALVNEQGSNAPTLSPGQTSIADQFLDYVLECFLVVGIPFFVPIEKKQPDDAGFYFTAGEAQAEGFRSAFGFVVRANSAAKMSVNKAFEAQAGLSRRRQWLIDQKILVSDGNVMRFGADYDFKSPSAAASIVAGNPLNGRVAWKTADGKTLKDVEEGEL